jgi:hypothetical protein
MGKAMIDVAEYFAGKVVRACSTSLDYIVKPSEQVAVMAKCWLLAVNPANLNFCKSEPTPVGMFYSVPMLLSAYDQVSLGMREALPNSVGYLKNSTVGGQLIGWACRLPNEHQPAVVESLDDFYPGVERSFASWQRTDYDLSHLSTAQTIILAVGATVIGALLCTVICCWLKSRHQVRQEQPGSSHVETLLPTSMLRSG